MAVRRAIGPAAALPNGPGWSPPPGFTAWLDEPAGRPGMTTVPTELAACAMVPALHPVELVNLKFTFNCRSPIRGL